jgi:uncharacterized protein involved in exopolysaccharide biosynthesis
MQAPRRAEPSVSESGRPTPGVSVTNRRRHTPSQAVVARPFLVVLPVLVLLVPALALALARQPVYSAEARLLVGGFNVEAQAVPGFVEASRTLAETYSRLVPTRAVGERVAEILELDIDQVSGNIDATSVPESSIIKVTGTGGDAGEAVRYAAAAAQALEDYADQAASSTDIETLLDEYRQASLTLNQVTGRATALRAQYDALVAAGTDTEADLEALSAAEADVARAQLEAETLANAYAASRERSGSSGNIDLVAPATSVGSDRSKNLQLAIAGPLLLGLVAGVALATLVANRRGTTPAPAHAAGGS